MAARVTPIGARRGAGAPTVRASIDAFLAAPRNRRSPHTARAYANVLDRLSAVLGTDRDLATVTETEIGAALDKLWGDSAPATWNQRRTAVGSWLSWCVSAQRWDAPPLPPAAERRQSRR